MKKEPHRKSSKTDDNYLWSMGKSSNLYSDLKKLDIRILYLFQIIGVAFTPIIVLIELYSVYSFYFILTGEIPVNITTTLFYTANPAPINSVALILGCLLFMIPTLIMTTAPVNAIQGSDGTFTQPEKQTLSVLAIATVVSFTATYYSIETNTGLVSELFYLTAVFMFILITDINRRNISVRSNLGDIYNQFK